MQFSFRLLALSLLPVAVFISVSAYATEETTDPYQGNLFGNMGGKRGELASRGVDTTVEYKGDFWRNASGGIKRGDSYIDNLDVKFALDGEKLFNIPGNRSLIYFLTNEGGKPNARQVGSTQGIDNIETAKNAPRLYELWTEQSFFGDKLAVLLGLHDLNAEFYENDSAANFLKPVMQIGQTLAQSGQNGPSIFPNTSLAVRVKYTPTEASYLSLAAFDGVPNNPSHPYATRFDVEKGDGLLLISEAGFTPKTKDGDEGRNKFALGLWRYTHATDDLIEIDAGGAPVKQASQGAYLISSYQFYSDKEQGHTLDVFFKAGVGDGDTAQIKWSYEAGLVGNGWMPTRPDSEIGLGMAQAHNSHKYVSLLGGAADVNETSFELYYRDRIWRGISLQPDLQYIISPGTDPALKNATVIGMRLDVNF